MFVIPKYSDSDLIIYLRMREWYGRAGFSFYNILYSK